MQPHHGGSMNAQERVIPGDKRQGTCIDHGSNRQATGVCSNTKPTCRLARISWSLGATFRYSPFYRVGLMRSGQDSILTLEDRQGYRPSDCFETFPLPAGYDENPILSRIGVAYHDFRAAMMTRFNEGLTVDVQSDSTIPTMDLKTC